MKEQMKPSGIEWIGDIPEEWETNKIKYISSLKGRIGWQGLTSDEYADEGPYLITGVDFLNGGINWDSVVHVSTNRWLEASDIQVKNGTYSSQKMEL
jgi:restriction endonuclease S subunit